MAKTLNKDNVKIWLAPANTVGSEFSTSADVISGFVTSFSSSGFGQDIEQIDVAGGNVTAAQPREVIEATMEIVLTDDTDRDLFNQIKMGEYDLGVVAVQKHIGGTDYLWEAVNNVSSSTFEGEFSMDGQWEGTLTIKTTAFDENGKHNWDYGKTDIENATTGLVAAKSRTLADGTSRTNSWTA